MKKQIDRLASRVLRLSLVVATLLLTAETCYAPWQKAEARKEAGARFVGVKESIYVPPDAILLAEISFNEQDNYFAYAGMNQIYTYPRPCMEIIDEYRTQMIKAGWTLVKLADSCDHQTRLWMHSQEDKAEFSIEATASPQSRLADKWHLLQSQYRNLYYVSASLAVSNNQ